MVAPETPALPAVREAREAWESIRVSRANVPGFRRETASENLWVPEAPGSVGARLPEDLVRRIGNPVSASVHVSEPPQRSGPVVLVPDAREGSRNSPHDPELPTFGAANIADSLPAQVPAVSSPEPVIPSESGAMNPGETPEKWGESPHPPSLPRETDREAGRSRNPAGMTSASSGLAMVDHLFPSTAPGVPPRQAESGELRSETAVSGTVAPLPEVPLSGIATVRPSADQIPSPMVTDGPAPRSTARLQELITGEAMLLQRIRSGSMTAVLRPDPSSELRVELRRRTGGIEIRATVERGDSQAIAEGWAGLQQQLRGQGINLLPLEREPSASISRNVSEPGGERPSSQSGGRGRNQQPPQETSPWVRSQGGSPSTRASGTGSSAPSTVDPRRRLLESWA